MRKAQADWVKNRDLPGIGGTKFKITIPSDWETLKDSIIGKPVSEQISELTERAALLKDRKDVSTVEKMQPYTLIQQLLTLEMEKHFNNEVQAEE